MVLGQREPTQDAGPGKQRRGNLQPASWEGRAHLARQGTQATYMCPSMDLLQGRCRYLHDGPPLVGSHETLCRISGYSVSWHSPGMHPHMKGKLRCRGLQFSGTQLMKDETDLGCPGSCGKLSKPCLSWMKKLCCTFSIATGASAIKRKGQP